MIIPDISMCTYESCIKRENCYRARATPSEWQSFVNLRYVCREDNGYAMFTEIDGRPVKELELKSNDIDKNNESGEVFPDG